MATFTEQATLKVVDQSSAQIKKINAELKALFATARSLKSTSINLRVNATGLRQAATAANQLAAAMRRLQTAAGSAQVRVNLTQLNAAMARLQRLRQLAAQPITVAVHGGGRAPGGRGGAGPGGGVQPFGGRGIFGPRTPPSAFAYGLGAGVGGGLGSSISRLAGSFGVLSASAYAAGAALNSIAQNAATRDRTNLQAAVAASEAQRKIFAAAGEPEGLGRIRFTQDERSRFRQSLLGDIQGTETERAYGAVAVADMLERQVLPRMFAQAPGKTRDEVLDGFRKLVQAMNLGSTDIAKTNLKTGKMEFTAEGARVLTGMQMAMAADPDLTPQLIKTVMANLKSAAYTLSERGLATVLYNAGNRGQRAANETFRAIAGTSGGVDVKALNESLVNMGLLQDVKRKPTKRGTGTVIAGSGTPVDADLLRADPSVWFDKNVTPLIRSYYASQLSARADAAEKAAKEAGLPPERVKAVREEAAQALSATEITQYVDKFFSGMSAAGRQGITDMITGFQQNQSTLAQAELAMQQNVNTAVAASWAAAAESVKTAWTDAAAGVGEKIAQSINLSQILGDLAQTMRDHPITTVATSLGVAAAGLITAGGLLLTAAGRLMAGGAVPPVVPPTGAPTVAPTAAPTAAATATVASTAMALLRAAGPIIAGALAPVTEQTDKTYANLSEKERERERLLARSYGELYNANQALKGIDQKIEIAGTRGGLKSQESVAGFQREKAALEASVQRLTAEIARLSQPGAPTKPVFPEPTPDMIKVPPEILKSLDSLQTPPAWISDIKTSIGTGPAWLEDVKTALSVDTFNPFNAAVSQLSSAPSLFASTFTTGATEIGASGTTLGQTASSIISSGAASAGAVLGNAAVSAIQAGVSNLNINVNANVQSTSAGVDKGSQKAQ